MNGSANHPLKARDIRKVGKRRSRRELFQELGKIPAEFVEIGGARRIGRYEEIGSGGKEVVSDKAMNRRKGKTQRFDHAYYEGISVDIEAVRRHMLSQHRRGLGIATIDEAFPHRVLHF